MDRRNVRALDSFAGFLSPAARAFVMATASETDLHKIVGAFLFVPVGGLVEDDNDVPG